MKKITLFIFSLIVGLVIFCGLSVKADPATLTMVDGAQIRIAEPAGLRFQASASSLDGTDEHGFYVAVGEHTLDAMRTAIEAGETTVGGNKLVKRSTTGEDLEFAVTIYGMDELSEYAQVITAVAYLKSGDDFTFDKAVTRNIAEKARQMYNASNTPAEIVATVAAATRVKVTGSDSSVAYYADIDDVTFAAGDTAELVRGSYEDSISIGVNNVSILGPNANVAYDGVRGLEAELAGQISIAANTHYLTINGLKFVGEAKVVNAKGTAGEAAAPTSNTDNFTFKCNIVETNLGSGNGFIYFQEAGSSYSMDLTFTQNYFKCVNGSSTLASLVYIDNNRGLIVTENKFEDAPKRAFYVNDATKGLAGSLTVEDNIFTSIGTNAFDVNWFSPYPNGDATKDIVFNGNVFDTVTGKAISMVKANTTDTYHSFDISNNEFTSVGVGFYSARISSSLHIEMTGNEFTTRPTTAYAVVDALYDGVKLNAQYNSFKEGGVSVLPNAEKYAAAKINIFSPLTGTPDSQTIKAGNTVQLASANLGLDMQGTVIFVSCSSDDEDIATVSAAGLITAVAEGETDIRVQIEGYERINLVVHVTVTLEITGPEFVLEGSTVNYAYAGAGTKVWSTSDDFVAEIDENGQLTAWECGTVDVILSINSVEVDRFTILVTPNQFLVNGAWSTYDDDDEIVYNTKTYIKGFNAFDNIQSAIAANRTITVLAGTYSSNVNVNANNVTIKGPNYGNAGKNVRETPANITGILTISGNYVEINGLEFTRNVVVGGNNATIDNCYISCTPETACANANRKACIVAGANVISDVVIRNSYINADGANTHETDYIAFYNITNLDIRNNYITNSCATLPGSSPTNDGMMLYYLNGTLNIYDNEFYYATNNYLMRTGGIGTANSTNATINVYNNIFSGRDELVTCTLGFMCLSATSVVTVMNNQFIDCEPSTITTGSGSKAGATLVFEYNYITGQKAKIYSVAATTTNHNCYAGGTVTTGTNIINIGNDAVTYANLAEVQAAYAEYLAN